MIEKLNDLIFDECKNIKKYTQTYSIDEFIEKYSGEIQLTLLVCKAYLSNINDPDDQIEFNNALELYQEILYGGYDEYEVNQIITEYDQIGDLTNKAIEFINNVGYNDRKAIIKLLANSLIDNVDFDIDEEELDTVDEEFEEILNIIKSLDDDELVEAFETNDDISDTLTYNYCNELYEIYQNNKCKFIDYDVEDYNEVECTTINSIARNNIRDIIDEYIEIYQSDLYKIIRYYLFSPSREDKLKYYESYILIYDYLKANKKENLYYNYIKDNDIKDIYVLFKNDNDFSKAVINSFIDNYLYLDTNNNNINNRDDKILTKKFFPIIIMDYLDKYNY